MEEKKESKGASELCTYCNKQKAKILMVCLIHKSCRQCKNIHKLKCPHCNTSKNSQSNQTLEQAEKKEQKVVQNIVDDEAEDNHSDSDVKSNEAEKAQEQKEEDKNEESQQQENQQKKELNPQNMLINIFQFESQIKPHTHEGNYQEIAENSNKSSSNLKQKEVQWQQKYLQMKKEYEKKLQEQQQAYQIQLHKKALQFGKLQQRYEILRQKNMALESKINQLKNRQDQSINQKGTLNEKMLQLQRQAQKYKEIQQNERQQRKKQTQHFEIIKKIINDYHIMLVNHFEEINSNFSYGLALEKIKTVKSLIQNFETIMTNKSPQIESIISANKPIINKYISNDLKQFSQEISKMEINFELFNKNKMKIILQKLKLYKEIVLEEEILSNFQNFIANKINHFLKTVVHKKIVNNKTAKNQFVIIEYLNQYLIFQANFEEEIKVVYEKCRENLNLIRNNLLQNFKKIQNMYFSLKLNDPQYVKKIPFNKENIEVLVKLIISIKIIAKNKKYLLQFQKEKKKKISQFKDDINKKLTSMRNNIYKQIENKETIFNYENNYQYFISLTKMKDFDHIWQNEENFYYNFRFTELYEHVSKRNESLKRVKEHEIHQMIGQEKIMIERLKSEIDTILQNQQMFRVLTCRVREVFTKKLFKIQKMNQFSLINQENLQKFKQFCLQIKQFQRIIKDKKQFEKHFEQQKYKQIIENKTTVIFRYLEQRFIYFFQNYNSPSFDQIQKEIKYIISFQEFLMTEFSVKHKELKKILKNNYKSLLQNQQSIFKNLQQIIQQGKQFIQYFIQIQQIKNEDYDKIKKFRRSFSSNQEEIIDKKIQIEINSKITKLQEDHWLKGQIKSSQQYTVRQNIDKLSPQLQKNLKEKLERLKNQIVEQMKRKQEQVKNKLKQQGSNYIKDSLIPLIFQQRRKKSFYQQKFQNILQEYLNNLLDKQFKEASKRKQFIEQYIHKIKDVIKDDQSNLLKIYEKVQFQAYRIQSFNMPKLTNNIHQYFFSHQTFLSKKIMEDIQQLNELANLRIFYQQSIGNSLLSKKKRDAIFLFFGKRCEQMKQILSKITQNIKIQGMNKCFNHEKLFFQFIKTKIIQNLCIKISYFTDKSKPQLEVEEKLMGLRKQISNVQPKLNLFNYKIKKAVQQIHQYSFTESLSRQKITDGQILSDLLKKDITLKNLVNLQQYSKKYEDLIKNPVVNLNIFEIKHQELLRNLELSWKNFYQISIREEMNIIFKIEQKISHKFQMFIKIKNIVKQNRIKIFDFITKQQYDIKKCLIQQSKKIFQNIQKDIKQCNEQYIRYILEIKGKQDDIQAKKAFQINKLKQHYKEKEKEVVSMYNIIIIDQNEMLQAQKQKQTKLVNIKKSCKSQVQEIQRNCQKIIDDLQDLWLGNKKNLFIRITDKIRVIKKLSLDFTQQGIKEPMENHLNEMFKEIQKLHPVLKEQFLLQFYEKKATCHFVANIVQAIELFTEFKVLQFNESVKHQGINYVIQKCPSINCKTSSQKEKILNDFEMYKKQLEYIQKSYKQRRTEENLNSIIKSTISSAQDIPAPILLGRIFGIQSILRIKHKQLLKFIRNPHPSQIVTILLLIEPKNKTGILQISNGMAQVKTGEGKSVVLAGLCCFLALKGYYTYCACYSSYLSIRDEKQYHHLFETLQILDKVVYGTFADHCKGILDEKNQIYFKDVIYQCLLDNNQSTNNKYLPYLQRLQSIFEGKNQIKRILIIDEVDVFFQERYFGQFYRPAISLENQFIKQLIKFIWKHRNLGIKPKQKQQLKITIKDQPFYKDLIKGLNHLSSFFQNQLQGMICAAVDPKHTYQIVNKKIVYRYNGIIQQSLNNGYKTVFSAFQQMEKNNISEQFFDKTLRLSLIISQFSYAQLPKYFTNILGVSGTLQTLSKSKKNVMREKYNIKNFYILPSIYGDSRRKILDPVVITGNDYELQLIEKIKQCSSTGRPVLVFFRNKNDMILTFRSEKVKENISDSVFLSEDEEDHMRDSIIRLAGNKGRVTFMTSYFSRGTDFLLENKELIEAGGFHVIQTYISKDESDYVQVYGRTARQGKKGTFQMVVKQQLFAGFSITSFESTKLMKEIKQQWSKKDQQYGQNLKQKIDEAKQLHQKSYNVIKSLSKETTQLIKQIQRLNFVKMTLLKNIKSIIAIDGTASMNQVLLKVKEILKIAIVQTEAIIESKNINASFQQQIMIYRNYNSQKNMLECSGFMNDSQKLTNWIRNIQVDGGWINQAIQVAYSRINSQENVNQIIIIGDARCNTKQQMIQKRNHTNMDPKHWETIGIPFVSSPQEELEKIILKKIPIHSLYLLTTKTNQGVAEYFSEISSKTNGVCKEFNINDKDAGKILANFIAQNVLKQIGGQQLVEQYKMRFG